MGPSRLTRTGLMVGAIAALAACADTAAPRFISPDASLGNIPGGGSAPLTDNVPVLELFKVCKVYVGAVGPAVTVTVTAPGVSDFDVVLNDGECRSVWVNGGATDPNENVSVTEAVPAGYTASWTKQTITAGGTVNDGGAGNTASGAVGANPLTGVVVTFTNTEDTPPPPPFCTLTQGYWKNHPEDWNDAGDNRPFLTTDLFFNSGLTYLQILQTSSSGGNAYIQLAHQYIAAVLNTGGNPSGDDDVDEAIADAEAFFTAAAAGTPAPAKGSQLRADVQADASTLDQFNNGILGPGHCDD